MDLIIIIGGIVLIVLLIIGVIVSSNSERVLVEKRLAQYLDDEGQKRLANPASRTPYSWNGFPGGWKRPPSATVSRAVFPVQT